MAKSGTSTDNATPTTSYTELVKQHTDALANLLDSMPDETEDGLSTRQAIADARSRLVGPSGNPALGLRNVLLLLAKSVD